MNAIITDAEITRLAIMLATHARNVHRLREAQHDCLSLGLRQSAERHDLRIRRIMTAHYTPVYEALVAALTARGMDAELRTLRASYECGAHDVIERETPDPVARRRRWWNMAARTSEWLDVAS